MLLVTWNMMHNYEHVALYNYCRHQQQQQQQRFTAQNDCYIHFGVFHNKYLLFTSKLGGQMYLTCTRKT